MTQAKDSGFDTATVVIPNWNGMAYLEGCLTSLENQSMRRFRVIMIDNGSTDGSVEYVRKHFPDVRIRAFHSNTGFCRAVNEGIALAETPYVILLNNDTVCDEHFVEKLCEAMDRQPEAFSCAARMMQLKDPGLIDDAGDFYCALGWAFADGHGLAAEKRMKRRRIFAACAGAAIYRRNLLEKLGLFDERQFAYLEDIDIGWRALRSGYSNWYEPEAVVFHAGSATTGSAYNPFKTSLAARNSIYIIRKNMARWQILLNLPFLLAGFAVKTIFFVRKGLGKSYLSGLRDGFKLSRSYDGPEPGESPARTLLKIQAGMLAGIWLRLRQN